jgi:hypothetical protein
MKIFQQIVGAKRPLTFIIYAPLQSVFSSAIAKINSCGCERDEEREEQNFIRKVYEIV